MTVVNTFQIIYFLMRQKVRLISKKKKTSGIIVDFNFSYLKDCVKYRYYFKCKPLNDFDLNNV